MNRIITIQQGVNSLRWHTLSMACLVLVMMVVGLGFMLREVASLRPPHHIEIRDNHAVADRATVEWIIHCTKTQDCTVTEGDRQ